MNKVLYAIEARTSCRHFTDKKVSDRDLMTLMHAAMAAPTAMNVQPWRFIIVDERPLLDALADKLPYAKMLREAPMAVAVCGDTTPKSHGQVNDGDKNEFWMIDCAAAAENLLVAAQSIGLSTCWTAVYPYPDRIGPVLELLQIPEPFLPLCIIPVGYSATALSPKDKYKPEKISYNKF